MKRPATFFLLACLLFSTSIPAAGGVFTVDYLYELGVKFYNNGRYEEALQEFKKALLVQPGYQPAMRYISILEETGFETQTEQIEGTEEAEAPVEAEAARELFGSQKKRLAKIMVTRPDKPVDAAILPRVAELPRIRGKINLDESFENITWPLELPQQQSVIVYASGIQRFLVTEPRVLAIEKINPDQLAITGNELGYTYVHIWDDAGRKTLQFLTVPKPPQGETLDEKMRRSAEAGDNFIMSYSLDWLSYESGRRFDSLERTDYSFVHRWGLRGATPYGDLDSSIAVNRFQKISELSNYTVGLTDGRMGPFRGFTLRAFDFFDYPPAFSNLSFPGIGLRGGMISSPAFDNKLNYTAFYGREHWTGYGSLSPDLNEKKDVYLNGINLTYTPAPKQNYKFTLTHGWGKDRDPDLNPYGYDLSADYGWGKWKAGYEIASDSKNLAHILETYYTGSKFRFGLELRDINKKFNSITGSSSRQGELGGILTLDMTPTEKLNSSLSLNVYRDRLYPAEDNRERLNEDVYWNTTYRPDEWSVLRMDYSLQNELGRLSQYRYQNADIGFSRTIRFIRDIELYSNYYHQENSNFSSPESDYVNERADAGLRFNITNNLYFYASKEFNWLTESFTGNKSTPNAFETGLDWSRQIGASPFYGKVRFTYRDEENTASSLSFLSGEDYIEGYSQLSYRPSTDTEVYGSCRIRNVWADNPNVNKRIEASFNAGMSYLWDTGVNWQSVCNIEGYVFKDYNSDGIIQRDEPPVMGVKVWLGKGKPIVTDIFGYYKFKGVRGKKAYVTVDTATIPSGFILTVPAIQETYIDQGRTLRLDFGMVARSEISGFIFEDTDNNGAYSRSDKGVRNVVVSLEDGSRARTDESGRYSFPHVAPGEHAVTLDLNTLPVYYLPKTAVAKKITLFEGVTYSYNIPLKVNR